MSDDTLRRKRSSFPDEKGWWFGKPVPDFNSDGWGIVPYKVVPVHGGKLGVDLTIGVPDGSVWPVEMFEWFGKVPEVEEVH